jgi:putative MFS transporter
MENTLQKEYTIHERIDRLPLTRELTFIMLMAGCAWLIESYDIGIMGNVIPLLQKQFHLTATLTGLLVAASTLGIVVAVIPAGWLADRFGRKKILIVGTAWYAIFSLLCGFSSNITTLLVLRFISGLGMGAVFPIPYALATEFMPHNRRGAMVGILDSFLSVGYFLAPLIALALISLMPASLTWRYLFYIGGLPILYIPVIWKWMPESPRWLQSQGRASEADSIVRRIESYAERRIGHTLPVPPSEMDTPRVSTVHPLATIFRRDYLRRTLMMWIAFSCILFIFYAIQTYTPTVLVKEGYGLSNAFLLTTIIVVASIPGKYCAAYAVERFGRKPTLIVFTVIAALSAIAFGFANTAALALGFGIVMSFFGIGVDPVVKVYGAEQYPTPIRETGVGSFESVGRLFGGALAPYIMAFLLSLASGGIPIAYMFIAVIAIIGVLSVGFLGLETKGAKVELLLAHQELRKTA